MQGGNSTRDTSRNQTENFKTALYWYPCKIQTLQALTALDKQRRLQFARHALSQSCGATEYLSKVVFFDECIFNVNRYVKKQNVRTWAKERPIEVNEVPLNIPGAILCCALYPRQK